MLVRERAHVSGAGATAGSCPVPPVSFGVGFAPLAARYRLWFAVRASDAFSRDYPPQCAFRPCLAVYGPYSERERGVVDCGGMLMALAERLAVSFLSRVSVKSAPANMLIGWGALFLATCAARLSPGARRIGFDVRASGVNGDLAACEAEVRGL